MTAAVLEPRAITARYRDETIAQVEQIRAAGREVRVVGLLGQTEGPAAIYAKYARRGFEAAGITLDVWQVTPDEVEQAIARANHDETVDGIFLYYPFRDPTADRWLRELVDPRKDVEGMHSFWARLLWENQRFVDPTHQWPAILPCTPLAILKLLQHAVSPTGEQPLRGLTACVINRSDIVGKPLAAMLANDGVRVHSLDADGAVIFEPAQAGHTHFVADSDYTREQALAEADLVVSAVPVASFEPIEAHELREGAICVNVSERANFADSVMERAAVFVPRVGQLTVTLAARNAARLAAQH